MGYGITTPRHHDFLCLNNAKCSLLFYIIMARKSKIQQLIADYPYYSNVHLANKYNMTMGQISNAAKYYHLHKDFDALRKVRKGRQRDILAEYSTRPTHEVAAEMGITVDALCKRANRVGVYKTECTARPRKKTMKERTVLVFAHDYTISEIADSTGINRETVRAILKRNGITPKAPQPKQVVIQWTLDGQFVARHANCSQAAKSLPNNPQPCNIYGCCKGINKSAYGYRWTIEKL